VRRAGQIGRPAPEAEILAWQPEPAAPAPEAEIPAWDPEPAADPAALWDDLSAGAPAATLPADEATAWWDDEPEPAPAEVAEKREPATSGRFALGGFAMQPGQQALGGVTFRAELPEAPSGWAVAPAADAVAGTLVLVLDGAINCDAGDLEVVTDPGFAPTTQGFTVRVGARAPGPFAASGTFRVV
jgi:hypothetical protein